MKGPRHVTSAKRAGSDSVPDLGTHHAIAIGLNHFHHLAELRPSEFEYGPGERTGRTGR
jgi:hypothetical protein